MSQQIMELVEKSSLLEDVPQFEIGDTVDVHTKILEGEKERIQVFSGVVIAKSGSGTRAMFTVRRRRRAPLPAPLATDRQGRGQTERRGTSRQVVLPPRSRRQGRPPQGTPPRREVSRRQ
jgi:large subunit ribosomal protein L19